MSDTAAPAWGTIQPGDIITARPWESGYELDAQQGIALGAFDGVGGEYVTVWFQGLGALSHDEIGHAVQPILRVKVQSVTGTVTTWSAKRRAVLCRTIDAERIVGTSDLYQVLVAQYRQETGQ